MGQLVAVFSPDTGAARKYLGSCIDAMQFAFGRAPRAVRRFSSCAVATFPRLTVADESGMIHDVDAHQAWSVGVGTWVCSDGMKPNAVAVGLAAGLRKPAGLPAHLSRIEGGFCFLTASFNGERAQLITDPIGQLHIYQTRLGDATLISTSALALAQVTGVGWDITAVREFLAKGTVFEHRSLFSGVRKVGPATIHTFAYGRPRSARRYWSVQEHVEAESSASLAVEAFADAVTGGTSALLRRFERPALDLTGGFDSRILLACALKSTPGELLNTVVTGRPADADVVAADGIARALNLAHRRLEGHPAPVDEWWRLAQTALPLVDGECNILEYAAVLNIHQQLAIHFSASINGSGGELIRGYWWELLFPRTGARRAFDANQVARARFAADRWAEPLLNTDFTETLEAHFSGVIQRACEPLAISRNTACMDNVYITLRMQRWQGRMASATNQLWPCASPLLFRRALEVALGAPIAIRRNGRMARHLLKRLDHELARLPMAGGCPALPLKLRNAHLFLPLGREYAQRATRRILVKSGIGRRVALRRQEQPASALLQLEQVAEYLTLTNMLTMGLYDQHNLDALLSAVRQGNQIPMTYVGRLVTLECVARLLQRWRTSGKFALVSAGSPANQKSKSHVDNLHNWQVP